MRKLSPSVMHLGMGLICGGKIKDLIEAGFDFTVYLADWHSWINNKLGGVMESIRLVGEYFKHCFTAIGVDPDKVKYMWASELAQDSKYWEKVIQVGKHATLSRVKRTLPIMGRSFSIRDVDAASLFYPCMQVADIFYLDLDVACAGIDQRKAHMLAREISSKLGAKKPISLHTHLLMGLEGPSHQPGGRFDENEKLNMQITTKMSKSKPSKCIFIHDSPEEIREKIRNAYCPPRILENNPIIELVEYVVFPAKGELTIERSNKYGGTVTFTHLGELKEAYFKGTIHPLDLKVNVAEALVEVLSRVREYFKHHENILEEVKKIIVTR